MGTRRGPQAPPPLHWAPQADLAGAEDNSERHGQSAGNFYYPEGIGTELEGPVKGQEGLCGSVIGGHLYNLGTLCLKLPNISWSLFGSQWRPRALCCPHIVSP